jgi:rhamnosyltransferase subunit B
LAKRIVITSFGSYGDVYPYIGLARGLRAAGHLPVLAMPAFYREMAEREGLEFRAVRPDVDPSNREVVRRIMDARTGTEYIVREIIIRSLAATYEDLVAAADGADLIVSHPITFAAPIVAERMQLPWVSTVLAPMSFFSPHDLPVFPPMPWARRLGDVPGAAKLLVRMARRITRRWVEPVYALRESLGLDRGGDPIYEGQHSPHLVLGLFSRVLASPQPDWPDRVRITGAIPYNGADADGPLSEKLARFLDAGPAPVVFTLGTSAVGAAGNFYRESIAAAAALGVRAVLLAGPHRDNRPREALPEGMIIEDFAPHSALFPRASAIVHQGGAGTLHQALRAGRPTLVVPYSHDQPDNAYRVERLGVSRTLRPTRYRARRVERELGVLLERPDYRRRAEDVARQVGAEDAVGAATAAIEALMR